MVTYWDRTREICWDNFDSDILGFVEGDELGLAEGEADGDILGPIKGNVL
jgi:hypothetical protein